MTVRSARRRRIPPLVEILAWVIPPIPPLNMIKILLTVDVFSLTCTCFWLALCLPISCQLVFFFLESFLIRFCRPRSLSFLTCPDPTSVNFPDAAANPSFQQMNRSLFLLHFFLQFFPQTSPFFLGSPDESRFAVCPSHVKKSHTKTSQFLLTLPSPFLPTFFLFPLCRNHRLPSRGLAQSFLSRRR